MIKLIGVIVGAFFLFMVGLPLAGFLTTLVLKVFLPYLLLPVLVAVLTNHGLVWGDAMGTILIWGGGWIVLLQMARIAIKRRRPSLHWHEGHFLAAFTVLTLGLPFWVGKTNLEEEIEEFLSEAESAGSAKMQPSATD